MVKVKYDYNKLSEEDRYSLILLFSEQTIDSYKSEVLRRFYFGKGKMLSALPIKDWIRYWFDIEKEKEASRIYVAKCIVMNGGVPDEYKI